MGERIESDEDDQGILDSVRRILAQEAARDVARSAVPPAEPEDVFQLDQAMMIDPPAPRREEERPTRPPAPAAADEDPILGEEPGRQATRSLGALRDAMRERAAVQTHRGGPTIEEMVRDEIRPVLREWLDRHLPPLVERLVRAEIARIAEADRQ